MAAGGQAARHLVPPLHPAACHRRPPQAVLVPSEQLPEDAPTIRGYDFNQGCDLDGLLESMMRTGLQATALGQAIHEVNRMVGWWFAGGGGGDGTVSCSRWMDRIGRLLAGRARGGWAPAAGGRRGGQCPFQHQPEQRQQRRPPTRPAPPRRRSPQIRWRLAQEPLLPPEEEQHVDPAVRGATRCKIFLGYTSNLVSAGVREHIRYLVQVGVAGQGLVCACV